MKDSHNAAGKLSSCLSPWTTARTLSEAAIGLFFLELLCFRKPAVDVHDKRKRRRKAEGWIKQYEEREEVIQSWRSKGIRFRKTL